MELKILSRDELARLALKVIDYVKKAEGTVEEVSKSFRTRARELFETTYYLGCLHTVSFVYAKATTRGVDAAFKFLRGEGGAELLPTKKEEAGYALYGAALLHYLETIGASVDPLKLDEVLKMVSEREFLILPFMSWLKLFAEAELEAGE